MFRQKHYFQIADYRKSLKRISLTSDFHLPPKNKLEVHVFFEIMAAERFEYDDIYVKYLVDLPEKWSCRNPESLEGLTQTCQVRQDRDDLIFGHFFDLVLDYDIQNFSEVGEYHFSSKIIKNIENSTTYGPSIFTALSSCVTEFPYGNGCT